MKTVAPGVISGVLAAPPSKSMAQRAIALASLVSGTSTVQMGTPCDDIESSIRGARALGALVHQQGRILSITGRATGPKDHIDCGEAGLCLRMFAAAAALFEQPIVLHATGTLGSRPVNMVVEPLHALGALCSTRSGLPPVTVQGPLRGGIVTVDGTTSSQFLTGLLISLLFCAEDSTIRAPGLKSVPYVEMTVELLRSVGAEIRVSSGVDVFEIPGNQSIAPFEYVVPGDWSGAAFPLVAGAIAGEARVTGLELDSPQADRRILDALSMAGVQMETEVNSVRVHRAPLRSFEFDATHCPDLFPPLVALAVHCEGESLISGVHRLKAKESDRKAALIKEFGKLGASVRVDGDVMKVTGGTLLGGKVESHGDHRIAMGAAVAALGGTGPVSIAGSSCVSKSYPDFFTDIASIGAKIT